MIWHPCDSSAAFYLISWLFITQSEHDAYQIEAEYVSYLIISLMMRNLITQVAKSIKILIFCRYFFEFG